MRESSGDSNGCLSRDRYKPLFAKRQTTPDARHGDCLLIRLGVKDKLLTQYVSANDGIDRPGGTGGDARGDAWAARLPDPSVVFTGRLTRRDEEAPCAT